MQKVETVSTEKCRVFNTAKGEFGVNALAINQSELIDFNLPEQLMLDEIPTLNKFGYMKIELDEFCQGFIEAAANSKLKVLELGTAYGFIAQQVLSKGATLIANDISAEHLTVLIKNTPKDRLKNLFIYYGHFPKDVNLPSASLDAVLASRMMHFLIGEEITAGLKKIYNWLVPGGKLFFTACTPYHYAYKKFLPIFKERVQNNIPWPGIIDNQHDIAPEHAPYVPEFTHVFDLFQWEKLLPEHGFRIEKIKLFDYANNDSDGKGHIGFVATKI